VSLTKKQLFLDFRLQTQACARCPYSSVRDGPIAGNGEYRSPILIIGKAPRKRDDEEGVVFSGRAGKKLEKMLTKADLDLEKVYRTYLVRCYAGREPQFGEFAAFKKCQPHSVNLLKLMRPTAVVICGYKPFKWLILRWTREVVDEVSFYRWVGRTVRLKEVWGDTKFFIIQGPAELSTKRDPDAEKKSIEALKTMKAYVVANQKGEPTPLEMFDLKRRPHTRSQQETFGWS
jgi:uracil-DNA glycosylase family 4